MASFVILLIVCTARIVFGQTYIQTHTHTHETTTVTLSAHARRGLITTLTSLSHVRDTACMARIIIRTPCSPHRYHVVSIERTACTCAHAKYNKLEHGSTLAVCEIIKALWAGSRALFAIQHVLLCFNYYLKLCHINRRHAYPRGFGGVAILWKDGLQAAPIHSICSDRICAIKLEGSSSSDPCLILVPVYLPSTDYPLEVYEEYMTELERTINALQDVGPIIIMGDFNAHLKSSVNTSQNQQGNLLQGFIERNNLYNASFCNTSCPQYTFFTTNSQIMIDFCIVDASLVSYIKECTILDHHPLNLSDHLLLSASILWKVTMKQLIIKPQKILNWNRAVNDGSISSYCETVNTLINQVQYDTSGSTDHLNDDITNVCKLLLNAANDSIPTVNHKRWRPFFRDAHLKQLCKQSKKAWQKWRDAGKPNTGPLYEEKKQYKKEIQKYIQSCRARAERQVIQDRDELFRKNDKRRFKAPTKRVNCSKLVVVGVEMTKPTDVLCAWRQHFQKLAKSQGNEAEALSFISLSQAPYT